eukprot:COSAG01_NODE_1924_length_8886_cov_6.780699_11_plen_81_part_00
MPNATWHKFDMISASAVGDFDHHRQTYHAMVNYMDGVVGAMVSALQEKEMWADTLWVHQSGTCIPRVLAELYRLRCAVLT